MNVKYMMLVACVSMIAMTGTSLALPAPPGAPGAATDPAQTVGDLHNCVNGVQINVQITVMGDNFNCVYDAGH